MRLTRYTDFAMRVLIHLASHDEASSIAQIAKRYDISHNHLMKIVQDLGRAGFIATSRGRFGGIRLGRPANKINVGDVIRHTEEGFDLVDCNSCLIAGACGLPSVLHEATSAFLAVLDRYSLADIASRRGDLRLLFGSDTMSHENCQASVD
jgi:Rrf2 family nitric oxide-sensitive transcriptional repressor